VERIAVVTDSAANLPPDVAERHGIHVVPLTIVWGDETFLDGVDMTPQEFYARLGADDLPVSTSAPTPEQVLKVIDGLSGEVDAIVAVLLARELSSCIEEFEAVQQLRPEVPLHIVDTRTAAMAQGYAVLEAARAAASGATVEEVIARAQQIAGRVHILATVETLEYLRRGGRIGSAAALLGSMLQIKPIVGISPGHGTVEGVARPRTWHAAVERMLRLMTSEVGGRPVHVAVGHGAREEEALALAEELKRRFDVKELYTTWFTPVMAAHTGPILSVSFYTD
jgi:DegV family protein with EDD domain